MLAENPIPRERKPHAKPRPKILIRVYLRDDPMLPWIFEAEKASTSTKDDAVHIDFDDYYRRLRRIYVYPLDLVLRVEVDKPRGRLSDVEANR